MKKGSLGPAFHETLEFLESVEVFCSKPEHVQMKMKTPMIAVEDSYFIETGTAMEQQEGMRDMVGGYATLAGELRSSVKYKLHAETLNKMMGKYHRELDYIGNNYLLKLPHQYTTLILEADRETFVIMASERTMPEGGYPEMELEEGDTMICLTIMGYFDNGVRYGDSRLTQQKLSSFPMEIHLTDGASPKAGNQYMLFAPVKGAKVTDAGEEILENLVMIFNLFLASLNLTSVLRHKRPGVKPSMNIERRHKKRKKHEHPQFEHTVIQFEIDAPEEGQTGFSILQPKKRLHQVRGFWRTYRKTGKRVWVKGHWRGDKNLGVIRKDVELVTHEEEETA